MDLEHVRNILPDISSYLPNSPDLQRHLHQTSPWASPTTSLMQFSTQKTRPPLDHGSPSESNWRSTFSSQASETPFSYLMPSHASRLIETGENQQDTNFLVDEEIYHDLNVVIHQIQDKKKKKRKQMFSAPPHHPLPGQHMNPELRPNKIQKVDYEKDKKLAVLPSQVSPSHQHPDHAWLHTLDQNEAIKRPTDTSASFSSSSPDQFFNHINQPAAFPDPRILSYPSLPEDHFPFQRIPASQVDHHLDLYEHLMKDDQNPSHFYSSLTHDNLGVIPISTFSDDNHQSNTRFLSQDPSESEQASSTQPFKQDHFKFKPESPNQSVEDLHVLSIPQPQDQPHQSPVFIHPERLETDITSQIQIQSSPTDNTHPAVQVTDTQTKRPFVDLTTNYNEAYMRWRQNSATWPQSFNALVTTNGGSGYSSSPFTIHKKGRFLPHTSGQQTSILPFEKTFKDHTLSFATSLDPNSNQNLPIQPHVFLPQTSFRPHSEFNDVTKHTESSSRFIWPEMHVWSASQSKDPIQRDLSHIEALEHARSYEGNKASRLNLPFHNANSFNSKATSGVSREERPDPEALNPELVLYNDRPDLPLVLPKTSSTFNKQRRDSKLRNYKVRQAAKLRAQENPSINESIQKKRRRYRARREGFEKLIHNQGLEMFNRHEESVETIEGSKELASLFRGKGPQFARFHDVGGMKYLPTPLERYVERIDRFLDQVKEHQGKNSARVINHLESAWYEYLYLLMLCHEFIKERQSGFDLKKDLEDGYNWLNKEWEHIPQHKFSFRPLGRTTGPHTRSTSSSRSDQEEGDDAISTRLAYYQVDVGTVYWLEDRRCSNTHARFTASLVHKFLIDQRNDWTRIWIRGSNRIPVTPTTLLRMMNSKSGWILDRATQKRARLMFESNSGRSDQVTDQPVIE